MPLSQRTRWAQLRVGLMAIVGLSILGYVIILLSGSRGLFRSKANLYSYLNDSAALAPGSPVRLNGIVIGRVRRVELSGVNQPGRIVKLDMEVDSEYLDAIPVDSAVQITAENLLAQKSVNIKKGMSAIAVKSGAELKSTVSAELEDLFQQGYTSLASLDSILRKMDGIIDSIQVGKGTIGKLLVDETLYNKIVGIVDETHQVVATLNTDQGTLGKLLHDDKLYDDVRSTVARVNNLMDGLDRGEGTLGQLLKNPALYDDVRKTIADVRLTLADINAGKGTVGKLLKSDELHNQIQATIGRIDSLLDKMNNGQGTIGQLLVNPTLYESLDGTTRELHGLLKDFRANPKKFLRIKVGLF